MSDTRDTQDDMTTAVKLGARIQELRLEKGLTDKQLAEAASMSVDELSDIEKGAVWSPLDVVERLAQALEVQSFFLFTTLDEELAPLTDALETLRKMPPKEATRLLKSITV